MFTEALWILFAVILLILCAILLVFEIFIPSLGLLTVTALLCLWGGIYIFFQMSTTAGWIGVWTAIIMIPVVWVLVYKLLPKTKLGRVLELHHALKGISGVPDQEKLDALEGQIGTVVSPLRPVGMCEFKNRKVVCVSENEFIERQTQVKVIHVEGNKVTVRKIETD